MRLEQRETGGIANLARLILLEDGRFTVIDRRGMKYQRDLGPADRDALISLVQQLEELKPRRSYGRTLVSDPATITVSIKFNSHTTEIEALTDPYDQPPQEFWDLVRRLRQLASEAIRASAIGKAP